MRDIRVPATRLMSCCGAGLKLSFWTVAGGLKMVPSGTQLESQQFCIPKGSAPMNGRCTLCVFYPTSGRIQTRSRKPRQVIGPAQYP